MSYGCAGRRDERRQSAIPRIEASLKKAEAAWAKANAASKEAKSGSNKALQESAAAEVAYNLNKVGRVKACLDNTRANLGKGTAAMYKST